jgi:protein-tyrosine-phosphatase
MMTKPIRVLFLCTHNSARSQIAEATLRQMGGADFEVYSAGTEVTRVHPLALRVLQEQGIEGDNLYSKSLRDFLGQRFDFVITVCDQANESCPVFPGDPQRIHWSLPDPSAVEGTEEERLAAFRGVSMDLKRRLPLFIMAQKNARDRQATATS